MYIEGRNYDTNLKMNFNAVKWYKMLNAKYWLIEELGEMSSYSIDSNETKNTSLKKLHHIILKTFFVSS